MYRIEKHKRASPTKGEARFETFYSAMHSDKDYTGTFDAAKVQSFSFLADLNSFSLYLHRRLVKPNRQTY